MDMGFINFSSFWSNDHCFETKTCYLMKWNEPELRTNIPDENKFLEQELWVDHKSFSAD